MKAAGRTKLPDHCWVSIVANWANGSVLTIQAARALIVCLSGRVAWDGAEAGNLTSRVSSLDDRDQAQPAKLVFFIPGVPQIFALSVNSLLSRGLASVKNTMITEVVAYIEKELRGRKSENGS